MFGEHSPELYDLLYESRGRSYAREANELSARLQEDHGIRSGRLLDVACGTGAHASEFRRLGFDVVGVDISEDMLRVARKRSPDASFVRGDMASFDLGETFDAVVCLFSSIAYVRTLAALEATAANLARHLRPGGVLLVEPWFDASTYLEGSLHAVVVDRPDIQLYRLNHSRREGDLSVVDLHYVVGGPMGVLTFHEQHRMGLFSREDYSAALREAGLGASFEPEGPSGRGLHVGLKPD